MGYGCTICDDCLEVPAPDYREGRTERPAEASGSASVPATDAIIDSVARGTTERKSPLKRGRKRTTLDVRSGTPTDVVVTPCGHLFHQICIAQWFKDKNSMNCPACRKLCQQSKLIRLYPTVVPYHPGIDDGFILQQPTPTVPAAPPEVKVEAPASATSSVAGPSSAVPDLGSLNPGKDAVRLMTMSTVIRFSANTNTGTSQDPCNVPDDEDDDRSARAYPVRGERMADCNRPDCEDIRFLRETLMQDFEDIQKKYADALEEVSMRQATEQSLLALVKTVENERDTLRTKLSDENRRASQLGLKHAEILTSMERDILELRGRINLGSDGSGSFSLPNIAQVGQIQKRANVTSATSSAAASREDAAPSKRQRSN